MGAGAGYVGEESEMSYARWTGDSDVYVYEDSGGGVTCCGCCLDGSFGHYNGDKEGILNHLKEHIAKGHKVPDYCIKEIEEDDEI